MNLQNLTRYAKSMEQHALRHEAELSHSPGVWIVYFSLAALPIFGIGQLFIPSAQVGQRRYAFCLLAIYVASAAQVYC